MIENFIVQARRRVCVRCEQRHECHRAGVLLSIFAEESRCPLKLHPTRDEAIAERAWPSGAARISGCCDSAADY